MIKFIIDGKEVEWIGLRLKWDGNAVPYPRTPSENEVRAILHGWEHGYREGLNIGRESLRTDFRDLMGVSQ